MAVAVQQNGVLTDPEKIVAQWRDRIRQGRDSRRMFEPIWLSNLDFAAGRHHRRFDRYSRQLVLPREVEEQMARGEVYEVDVINERRQRVLGELAADVDRPELLLISEGDNDDDYQEQLNRAVAYGWDYEWRGDHALRDKNRKVIDLGTCAVRVRFDPTSGPVKQDQVPFKDGKPVLDLTEARSHVADTAAAGGTADLRSMHEGRIRWEVLSPFNLLVPPGVDHEDDFPWEIVVRPVAIATLVEEYGAVAEGLTEDTDIGNLLGVEAKSSTDGRSPSGSNQHRLRDHVWLYTCFQRPTGSQPKGRVVVVASNNYQLLDVRDELPVCAPDGTYRSGISYFHWWRVTGRFWSRSLVEAMKDIQRRVNKRTAQIDKTIDRGQAFVVVDKNSDYKRAGFPVEILALEPTAREPKVFSGVQPGPWMYQDKEDAISDLDRASGVGQSALGENPDNAQTYGQLALLHEQEAGKRSAIIQEGEEGKARLVEDSVHFIRVYWGPQKQLILDSEDDKVEARVFNATKVPTFFKVKVAKGPSKPRSQAAEIQKITDIWNAAFQAGVVAANPHAWISWYRESIDAGQAQELPEVPNDEHADKATLENTLLADGQPVTVAYYDPPQVHIPIHRDAQVEAEMAGEVQTVAALEQHIQEHLAMAQQVAEQQAQLEPVDPAAVAVQQQPSVRPSSPQPGQ